MSIEFIPQHGGASLEWDKIKALWASYAVGALAKEEISNFEPCTALVDVKAYFSRVQAILDLRATGHHLPLSPYDDIRHSIKQLAVEGYILEQEEVVAIYKQLRVRAAMQHAADKWEGESLEGIRTEITEIPYPKELIESFEAIFDESFEVRPDASRELVRIHRSIDLAQQRLNGAFNKIVRQYKDQGFLADTEETVRGGRRVLSVKSEHKRQISGIIHDESSGGKVTYVEPQAILDINNDIFDLRQEVKREVFRLVRQLCETLRTVRHELLEIQEAVVKWDLLLSRARFGESVDGICPSLQGEPCIKIKKGRHPLLVRSEKEGGDAVIPFDLFLEQNNHILIVSGPNAGGKTVLMKAVGLMQLLVQSGLPVPVDDTSTFGIYHRVMVDIGDQQSIEDDLSTYSSHLQNMKEFLRLADHNTLLLIDELGSGTDPRLGGAIAESILHQLFKRGALGVITTHYSNLKSYAHSQKGVLNGAMTFDKKHLTPTYQLRVGKPGSSFAFELAEKSKLPDSILSRAKKNAGQALVDVDKILADIQEERKEMEEKMRQLKIKESQADQLRLTYEKMQKDLAAQRKRLKMVQKEYDISKGVEVEKELNKLIDKLKRDQDLEKARKVAQQQKKELDTNVKALQKMEEEEWKQRQEKKDTRLSVGDHVKLRDSGTTGTIQRIEKGRAFVHTGMFELEVKLRDLRSINEPMDVRKEKSVKLQPKSTTQGLKPKLDIRGMPREEAAKILERYFDQALVQEVHQLEIVHGVGSGVLRQMVKDKIREIGVFQKAEHPQREFGGEGVTIITV